MSLNRPEYIGIAEGLIVAIALFWFLATPIGIMIYLAMQ